MIRSIGEYMELDVSNQQSYVNERKLKNYINGLKNTIKELEQKIEDMEYDALEDNNE